MPECSLLRTLWLESELFRKHLERMGLTFSQASRTQLHVHHIFGGKTRKDLPSNTITICGAVHDFCHAHQTEGRIACLWWKHGHGQLNWTEINEAAGWSVRGWLENHASTVEPFTGMASWILRDGRESAQSRPATAASTATSPPMPRT